MIEASPASPVVPAPTPAPIVVPSAAFNIWNLLPKSFLISLLKTYGQLAVNAAGSAAQALAQAALNSLLAKLGG